MPSDLPGRGPGGKQWPSLLIGALAFLAFLPGSRLFAQGRLPQREQVEQIQTRKLSLDAAATSKQTGETPATDTGTTDDAFGAQSILRERPRRQAFTASVENAVFYTDNAALTPDDLRDDTFLNSSLALGWRTSLTNRVSASILGRYGLFRYNRLPVLDFQSLDLEASVVLRLPAEVEMLAGYGFTQFTTRQDFEEFYSEHVLNFGLQRVFQIARAHYVVAGVSARWSWAAPEAAQRDRYSAYVSYHVNATERLSADLGYRYAFFDYRDGGTGRGDHNHSLSLSFRYSVTEWLNVVAAGQATWNRSTQPVFDYDAFNAGGSVGLNARF